MKRICVMLTVVLGLMSLLACSACAENTESPTLTVVLEEIVVKDETVLPDNFQIEVIEEEAYSESVVALFEEISTALQSGTSISDYFDESVKEAIASINPEINQEKLAVAEFIPLRISGLDELTGEESSSGKIGDVDVTFKVPGTYSDGDAVIAVFGVLKGKEVEWIPFQAKVVEGNIVVTFTADAFEKVKENETVLLLMREI